MRKWILPLLTITLLLTGCNKKENTPTKTPTPSPVITPTPTPTPTIPVEESFLIVTSPDKTTYEYGEDLDLTGFKVIKKTGEEEVDVTKDVTLSGYNKFKIGEQDVTVSYLDLSSSFKVIVNEQVIYEGYGYNHYNGYYGELTWTDSSDLIDKLYDIIHDGYTPLSYDSPNWESNQYADQDLYNHDEVNVVYSSTNQLKTFTSKLGNGGWQREHAFCASLMTGKLSADAVKTKGRATDFHNLFASNESGNTSRGNKNFGIANKEEGTYVNRGDYSFDNINFEPSNEDKGRLARAIFYMGVMYSKSESKEYEPLTIEEEYVSYEANDCAFAIGNLSTLISWNDISVDYLEYQHNESVYSHVFTGDGVAQGNRNPFIDYPELVDYVYGDKKDESGDLKYLKPTEVKLYIDSDVIDHYAVKNVKTTYQVGETFDNNCYELIKVDQGLREYEVSSEEDLTTPITLLEKDIGEQVMSVLTPINRIDINVTVEAAKENKPIDELKYFSGEPLTKANYVTMLQKAKTTLSVSGTLDLSQYSSNGIKLNPGFGTMTLTSESLNNIKQISIKTNSNKNVTYRLTMMVNGNEIFAETLTGIGTGFSPIEKYSLLKSPLSGVITITVTNCNGPLYLAALGIEAD